jgi:hypothetical protein
MLRLRVVEIEKHTESARLVFEFSAQNLPEGRLGYSQGTCRGTHRVLAGVPLA